MGRPPAEPDAAARWCGPGSPGPRPPQCGGSAVPNVPARAVRRKDLAVKIPISAVAAASSVAATPGARGAGAPALEGPWPRRWMPCRFPRRMPPGSQAEGPGRVSHAVGQATGERRVDPVRPRTGGRSARPRGRSASETPRHASVRHRPELPTDAWHSPWDDRRATWTCRHTRQPSPIHAPTRRPSGWRSRHRAGHCKPLGLMIGGIGAAVVRGGPIVV
jgi:hypothetical protein